MNIKLPLYQTAKGELRSLVLNYIYFPIEKPQECFRPLFKHLLYDLWLSGIFSYHHENRLYLVFQAPYENLLREVNRQLNIFIGRYMNCFPSEVYQEKESNFVSSMTMTELSPSRSNKDFVIARSIIYGYLRKVYGYRKGIIFKESIIYIYRVPEGEGKYIFDDKFIRQGVKFMFEVTPNGRGRIWFDVVTHAFKDELVRTRRLSHFEMKQESWEFYRKYLSLAQMKPKARYDMLMKMLNILGIQDSITIKYYLWDNNRQQFEEHVIKFEVS